MESELPAPNSSWTIFLDRDGVINRRLPGAYVRSWAEFEWLPAVVEAIVWFAQSFGRVIVVTNQQGIGKGLMDEVDLADIHRQMVAEVEAGGGRIDGVYFCPDLSSQQPNCRKPSPVMALLAQRDFPEIAFHHSIMVGDSLSDMDFGQQLGMFNVLVATKKEESDVIIQARAGGLKIDATVESLAALAAAWRNQK